MLYLNDYFVGLGVFCSLDAWLGNRKRILVLNREDMISPGMLPMRIDDQAAAIKLAICYDIGEKAYNFTDVARILVQMLARITEISFLLATIVHGFLLILCSLFCRFVKTRGLYLFGGDSHQAAF